jgi:hypothetical protein
VLVLRLSAHQDYVVESHNHFRPSEQRVISRFLSRLRISSRRACSAFMLMLMLQPSSRHRDQTSKALNIHIFRPLTLGVRAFASGWRTKPRKLQDITAAALPIKFAGLMLSQSCLLLRTHLPLAYLHQSTTGHLYLFEGKRPYPTCHFDQYLRQLRERLMAQVLERDEAVARWSSGIQSG